MADRPYDVVLFGSTGFTGKLAAKYFGQHASGLKWAIAGRSRPRLEALAQTLEGAPGVEVADSDDPASVDALVSKARVVLTTAGPFSRYSTPVVEACVRHRVDYVDITGETYWVRSMIDRFHAQAAAAGTRIIPFCGFDSVPSDLGAFGVVKWIREQWSQPTRRVLASFSVRGGGLNGGSLQTALTGGESGQMFDTDDVFLLNPPGQGSAQARAASADFSGTLYEPVRKAWLAPFVMGTINTRVVRRSAGLWAEAGEPYGPDFTYQEAHECKSRLAAAGLASGLVLFEAALKRGVGRAVIARLGPKPGEGPSEKAMREGSIRVRLVAEAQDGRKALATLSAQGDAGNVATVTMLCESALALATQRGQLPGGSALGGILTPARGLGQVLMDRLIKAGFGWDVAAV